MNKKVLLSVLLIISIAAGAGFGTFAYFTQTFESTGNTITAATFDVSAGGILEGEKTFSVEGLAPGKTISEGFSINKTKTTDTLSLEYLITLTKSGNLFDENSPVTVSLVENIGPNDNDIEVIESNIQSGDVITISADKDISGYSLVVDWPWETEGVNDSNYSAAVGNIGLSLEARQVEPNDSNNDSWMNVYTREKTNPTNSSNETNRVIFEGTKVTIENNSMFGTIVFANVTPSNADLTQADRYVSNGWNVAKNSDGSVQFTKCGMTGFSNGEVLVKITGDQVVAWYNSLVD